MDKNELVHFNVGNFQPPPPRMFSHAHHSLSAPNGPLTLTFIFPDWFFLSSEMLLNLFVKFCLFTSAWFGRCWVINLTIQG